MTIKLTEDEFEEQFHPIQKPDNDGLLEWEDVKDLAPENVWTIVETGDPVNDSWYAIPGFHYVNKIGYLRSETRWVTDDMEAVWFESWPELQNYDPEHRRYVLYFPGMSEYIYLKWKRSGAVSIVNGDGDYFGDELRDTLGEEDFGYLTGEYLRLVAEAYDAALLPDESETHAAQHAAVNVPLLKSRT